MLHQASGIYEHTASGISNNSSTDPPAAARPPQCSSRGQQHKTCFRTRPKPVQIQTGGRREPVLAVMLPSHQRRSGSSATQPQSTRLLLYILWWVTDSSRPSECGVCATATLARVWQGASERRRLVWWPLDPLWWAGSRCRMRDERWHVLPWHQNWDAFGVNRYLQASPTKWSRRMSQVSSLWPMWKIKGTVYFHGSMIHFSRNKHARYFQGTEMWNHDIFHTRENANFMIMKSSGFHFSQKVLV